MLIEVLVPCTTSYSRVKDFWLAIFSGENHVFEAQAATYGKIGRKWEGGAGPSSFSTDLVERGFEIVLLVGRARFLSSLYSYKSLDLLYGGEGGPSSLSTDLARGLKNKPDTK